MQVVSASFTPYAVERVCDMRVVFELVDVDAAATAVPDCSDSCSLAQLEQTHDGVLEITKKYATFEWNFWCLDGSFPLPEEDLTGTQTGCGAARFPMIAGLLPSRQFYPSASPTTNQAWASQYILTRRQTSILRCSVWLRSI